MNTSNVRSLRNTGSIVLQRLGELSLAKSLQPRVDAFTAADAAFQKASREVDSAAAARREAAKTVRAAAAALVGSVETLAMQVVGAGIGDRSRPFSSFSTAFPSTFGKMAFAHRPAAARALVASLRAEGKRPAAVEHAADAVLASAHAVDQVLAAITPVELAQQRALGEREPLAVTWLDGLQRLKIAAKAAWVDEPATFAAVVAPPEAIRAPRVRRKKGKAAAPAAPPAVTPAPPPAAPA